MVTMEEFSFEKMRKRVEKLGEEDLSEDDSIYSLAKKEDRIRTEMKDDNLNSEIVNKYADLFSTLELEKMELEKESLTDKLTGIKNRRALEQIVPKILDLERREKRKFSLLVLDIDHFKQYNDTLGHQAGDEILKQFPKVAGEVIRKSDLLFRCGGEEFVVALPETDKQGAIEVAEKIRKAVEDKFFEINFLDGREKHQKITLSIGVFSSEQMQQDQWDDYRRNKSDAVLKEMMGKADKALYQAKNEGRNRTVVFDESMNKEEKKGQEQFI